MTTHPLQCACGSLKGEVTYGPGVNRGVCYCDDCQAFATYLDRSTDVLDDRGGTDIVQMSPDRVRFTQGVEHLACLRLSEGGLMRWYARCCNTPIGNTASDYKMWFVGLIHGCLEGEGAPSLETSFGPQRMRVHTQFARGEPKPTTQGLVPTILKFIARTVRARLTGAYRNTPFFDATGKPVADPHILSETERTAVMADVQAA